MCIRDRLSERFGKIMQERNSVSINSSDTSISKSTQLDYAVPASKIASLSSGEFVGMVADDPDNNCLLYTSDAADERSSVDLGGRRIIKKKTKENKKKHTKRKKQYIHDTSNYSNISSQPTILYCYPDSTTCKSRNRQ